MWLLYPYSVRTVIIAIISATLREIKAISSMNKVLIVCMHYPVNNSQNDNFIKMKDYIFLVFTLFLIHISTLNKVSLKYSIAELKKSIKIVEAVVF